MSFSALYDTKFEKDSAKIYCKKALSFFEKYANKSVLYPRAINKYSFYLNSENAINLLLKYSDTIKLYFSQTSTFYFDHLTNILQKMLYGSTYNLKELRLLKEVDSLAPIFYKIPSDEFLRYEFLIKLPLLKKYNLISSIGDEMQFITSNIEESKFHLDLKFYLEYCINWAEYWKSIGNESYYYQYLLMGEKKILPNDDLDIQSFVDKKLLFSHLANYYRFKMLDSCIYYHSKILNLEIAISTYHGHFVVHEYTEIGKIYLSLLDYKNAELYLRYSLAEMEKGYGKNSQYYLGDLFTLGNIQFKESNGKKGLEKMYPFINFQLNNSSFIPPIGTSVYNVFGELYEQLDSDSSDRYYNEIYRRNTMQPLKMLGLTDKEQINALHDFNASLQTLLNRISYRFFNSKKTKANLELAAYLFSKNQQFEYQKLFKGLQNEKIISEADNIEMLQIKKQYNKGLYIKTKSIDSLQLNYEYFRSRLTANALIGNSGNKYLKDKISNVFKENFTYLQKRLGNGECYIDIKRFMYQDKELGFFADSAMYAFLIISDKSQDTGTYFFLKNGSSFDSIVKSNNRSSVISEYLKELIKIIQLYKNVYINPDGIFHLINWYTLKDKDNKYLLDNKTIHTIQSPDEVKPQIGEIFPKLNREVVLLGDPLMQNNRDQNTTAEFPRNNYNLNGASELPSLPYTRIEVEEIDKLFKKHGFNSTMYIQEYCNEENLEKVKSPIVLHIATHGFYLNKIDSSNAKELEIYSSNPLLRSGLILSASKSNDSSTDNIVTAFEVIDYNLSNTELVVLSACETGKGKIENGQGIYGLQRAFRIAGAKTVLTSLWNVDDKATRLFMKLFYTEWLNGESKVDALRNTQLQMAHHPLYGEPKFWGAFVLVGE
jgi:CHAT domain-containing protein